MSIAGTSISMYCTAPGTCSLYSNFIQVHLQTMNLRAFPPITVGYPRNTQDRLQAKKKERNVWTVKIVQLQT